jgi:hypothetical protein
MAAGGSSVLAHGGDQFNPLVEKRGEQGLRQIAFIAKELAKQGACHAWDGLTVINVGWGEPKRQQRAAVIDDERQFEAIEPAHRGFASSRQTVEDLVTSDTAIMAPLQRV